MPKNCNECEYTKTCHSFYGGWRCKHRDEIVPKPTKEEIEKFWKEIYEIDGFGSDFNPIDDI